MAVLGAHDFLRGCRRGVPLPLPLRRFAERAVGIDLQDVRLSVSSQVEAVGAVAVAAGERIAVHPSLWRGFDDQRSLEVLFHELTHVAQQRRGRVPSAGGGLIVDDLLERQAELVAVRAVRRLLSGRAPRLLLARAPALPGWFDRVALQAHPGSSIIRRGLSWLEKRSAKAISKHIAKHATRNFSKAVHSVFRSIDKIRPLIEKTLKEGAALAERFADRTGAEAIEEAGVKITRQATGTPGKFRWLVQKQFSKEIGTEGETVLRVVLDMSGRIVTAFPADKLLAIVIAVGVAEALTEGIADAAEKVAAETNRVEQIKQKERDKIDLWEWVPGIGDIWGGSLNQFEDLDLAYDRYVDRVVHSVIAAAEQQAGASLAKRDELEDIVRCGIGLPLMLENPF